MNGNYSQQGGGFIPSRMMMSQNMSRINSIPMMAMPSPQTQMHMQAHQQQQQMAMAQAYQNMAAAYARQKDMQSDMVPYPASDWDLQRELSGLMQQQHQQHSMSEERQLERDRGRRDERDIRDRDRERERDGYRRGERRDDRDRERDTRRRDDRDRRDSRDRDRSRDTRRSRDRSRSHDRGEREGRENRDNRESRDNRDNRDNRERDRFDDCGSGRGTDRDDGGSSRWVSTSPSNTLLLRNLAASLTEVDILSEFKSSGIPIKEVRLMKHKMTDFQVLTHSATQHYAGLLLFQNAMTIQGIHYVPMVYSAPRVTETGRMVDPSGRSDWICSKCNAHNFKRRDFCFKCDVPREESERTVAAVMEDGSEHVGINPCNTLLLRGLDALTTEETIANQLSEITGMPVKNVIVIRDDLTNTSKGYAFVELHSLTDSQEVLGGVTKRSAPLDIDGKAIIVTYARNTYSTTLQTLKSSAASRSQTTAPRSGREAKTSTASSSQSVITAQQQKYSQSSASGADSSQRKLTAAAQNAQDQAQWSTQNDYSQPAVSQFEYPAPDMSTYQYDETSGYYYDSTTGLYYDPNTQYYWNQETQQFMYWDQTTSTYQIATNQAEITAAAAINTAQHQQQQQQQQQANQADDATSTKKDKEKKDKVRMAKKIAKDMEKWAKSMNKSKNKSGVTTLAQPQPVLAEPIYTEASINRPSTADAGYAMLSGIGKKDSALMPPPSLATPERGGAVPGLVASYGGDSDDDDNDDDSTLDLDKLLDWNKMACLLCKRQFPNKDVLSKHIQLSDLHKKNVEELTSRQQNQTYRDRAKERRNKVGSTPPLGKFR